MQKIEGKRIFFFQTDRVAQESHPGDPEDALLCGQEEFSGNLCISIIINCQGYMLKRT